VPSFRSARGDKGRRSRSHLGRSQSARVAGGPAIGPVTDRYSILARLPGLVLLVGSLWVLRSFFADPRFRVSKVVVEGANLVRETEIARVLDVMDTNVFRVNTRELATRLESEFGLIEHAFIRCRLPDQVLLALKEREAVAVWESGGRHWWIGHQGKVLGETADTGGLVVIQDAEGIAPQPQEHIVGVPWELAQEMREAIPAIQAFEYTSQEGLVLYVTANEWPIYLGHEGDAQVKTALMWALVDELMAQGIAVAYIDLRNDYRPVYKRQQAGD